MLSCLILTALQSQIVETEKPMNTGVNNALLLEIPNADDKIVEKVWKTYAKSFDSKVKKIKKSDELITETPRLSGFNSVGLMNIIVKFEQKGENVEFLSWFELKDQFLNSYNHPDAFDEAQKLLLNFGLEVAKEYTLMELDDEEKNLKKMESDLKRLVKDKENYEKSIKEYEQRIVDAKAEIENNIIEQERMQESIDSQLDSVEIVKKKLANLNN